MATRTNDDTDNDILAASYKHGKSLLDVGVRTRPHKCYLFGRSIAHSMAPLLHNTLFTDHGLPWTYELFESTDTEAFVKLLKSARHSPGGGGGSGGGECIGSAITMPHKISFMAHVDELTDEAAMIGSINTVFVRRHPETGERRYIGTNTDCIGVREAFLQKVPGVLAASCGKPALVIGGGGACRGAVYALWKWLGASVIYLANRVQSEVDDVTAGFRQVGFPGKLVWVGNVAQAHTLETPAIIVGTIPDLPPREEGEIVCRQIVKEFLNRPTKGAMLDMCYHPNPVTALYRLAETAGWRAIGGTEVMVAQGIAQQILWCEAPLGQLRLDHAVQLVHEELQRRRPK